MSQEDIIEVIEFAIDSVRDLRGGLNLDAEDILSILLSTEEKNEAIQFVKEELI